MSLTNSQIDRLGDRLRSAAEAGAMLHASRTIASLEDRGTDRLAGGEQYERLIETQFALPEATMGLMTVAYHVGLFWGIMASAMEHVGLER
jgi:hypothetical protein